MPTDVERILEATAAMDASPLDTSETVAERVLSNLEANTNDGVPLTRESTEYLRSYRQAVAATSDGDALREEPTSQEATEALSALQRVGGGVELGLPPDPANGSLSTEKNGYEYVVAQLVGYSDIADIVPFGHEDMERGSNPVGVVTWVGERRISVRMFPRAADVSSEPVYGRGPVAEMAHRLFLEQAAETARIMDEARVLIAANSSSQSLMGVYTPTQTPSPPSKPSLAGAKPAGPRGARKIIRKKKT